MAATSLFVGGEVIMKDERIWILCTESNEYCKVQLRLKLLNTTKLCEVILSIFTLVHESMVPFICPHDERMETVILNDLPISRCELGMKNHWY